MKAVVETVDQHQRKLEIEVEEARVEDSLDRAFKKVVKNVNVAGFRKGKVPRMIFEKKFGVESLYQEALDIILPEVYFEAVKETGIDPIDYPKLDVVQFARGSKLIFNATVVVRPEVTLGAYTDIQVEEKDFSATDEDVAAELDKARDRRAELLVLEPNEKAIDGDTAIIDYDGFVDGVAFDGGKGERHNLVLGSNSFIPGFEEQLIGTTKGANVKVNVSFPEDYHHEPLAGKAAIFNVIVHDIKRKELPELNDELAQDIGEYDTLEEWKEDLKAQIAHRKLHDQNHFVEGQVVDAVVAVSTVEIPDIMIANETETMLKDLEGRLKQQGMNIDLYLQLTGMTKEALAAQSKPEAEKRVRRTLVLDAVAKAENIEVTPAELEEEFVKIGKQYNMSAEQVAVLFDQNQTTQRYIEQMINSKTVQFLVSKSSAAHLIHIHQD